MRHVHLLFAFPRNIKQMSFCKCQKAKGHQSSVRMDSEGAGWLASQ
jgi:hypothetical protein